MRQGTGRVSLLAAELKKNLLRVRSPSALGGGGVLQHVVEAP